LKLKWYSLKKIAMGILFQATRKQNHFFNLWWERMETGKVKGTGISFAASEFPWRKTEDVIASSTSGKPPQDLLSFGFCRE
jgi:hypothetical protein